MLLCSVSRQARIAQRRLYMEPAAPLAGSPNSLAQGANAAGGRVAAGLVTIKRRKGGCGPAVEARRSGWKRRLIVALFANTTPSSFTRDNHAAAIMPARFRRIPILNCRCLHIQVAALQACQSWRGVYAGALGGFEGMVESFAAELRPVSAQIQDMLRRYPQACRPAQPVSGRRCARNSPVARVPAIDARARYRPRLRKLS
jgi:hypothetical protein